MKNKTFLPLLLSAFILCLLPMAHAQRPGDISVELGFNQLSNVKNAFSAGYKQPTLTNNLPSTITATQTRSRAVTTTANSDSTATARSMNGFKLGVNYYLFDNLALGYGFSTYSNTSTIQFRSTKIIRTTNTAKGTPRTPGTIGTPTIAIPVTVSERIVTPVTQAAINHYNTVTLPTYNTALATFNDDTPIYNRQIGPFNTWHRAATASYNSNSAAYPAWLLANPAPPLAVTGRPIRPIRPIRPTTGKFTVNTKFASHSFYSRLLLPSGLYAQAGISLRDWTEKASGGLYKATWPSVALNLGAGGQWMLNDGFSLNAGLNLHVGGEPEVEVDSEAAFQAGLDPAFFKKTIEDNLAKTSMLYELNLGFGMTL